MSTEIPVDACQRCNKLVPAYTLNYVLGSKASGNLCMECAMYAFFGPAPPHQCRTTSTRDYVTCDVCAKEIPREATP